MITNPPTDILAFLLIWVAATYRISTDIAWENGPGHIFSRWQQYLIARFGKDHSLTELFSCPICLSFWVAPVTLLLLAYVPILALCLAVAGVVAFLSRH